MEQAPTWKHSLWNGFLLKCPKCGQGQLFVSYLKQVDACTHCHESYKQYRADDGPAWMTILITGHIIVPMLVIMTREEYFPYWLEIIIAFVATTLLALVLLPRTKGLFLAALWMTSTKRSQVTNPTAP